MKRITTSDFTKIKKTSALWKTLLTEWREKPQENILWNICKTDLIKICIKNIQKNSYNPTIRK